MDLTAMLVVTFLGDPLLCEVMMQYSSICWAISLVRQLDFALKKKNRMSLNEQLSIQDLVNRVPWDCLFANLTCKDIRGCGFFLRTFGVLLARDCQLVHFKQAILPHDTRARYHPDPNSVFVHYLADVLKFLPEDEAAKEYELFHSSIKGLLADNKVVTVRIPAYPSYFGSYRDSSGKTIYSPSVGELIIGGHFLLAIGWGTDENGRLFYHCQDSGGPNVAAGGYAFIYADTITAYVEMTGGESEVEPLY